MYEGGGGGVVVDDKMCLLCMRGCEIERVCLYGTK